MFSSDELQDVMLDMLTTAKTASDEWSTLFAHAWRAHGEQTGEVHQL